MLVHKKISTFLSLMIIEETFLPYVKSSFCHKAVENLIIINPWTAAIRQFLIYFGLAMNRFKVN